MTLPLFPSYREIPLTQGQIALVDEQDYESISRWKWFANWCPYTNSFYAGRNSRTENGKRYGISMHRSILGLERGDKRQADHKNHNTLDNRRDNLRIVTKDENVRNRRKYKNNTTGYKGVTYKKSRNRFVARTWKDGVLFEFGSRKTAEEAYALFCEGAKKVHGEFFCPE